MHFFTDASRLGALYRDVMNCLLARWPSYGRCRRPPRHTSGRTRQATRHLGIIACSLALLLTACGSASHRASSIPKVPTAAAATAAVDRALHRQYRLVQDAYVTCAVVSRKPPYRLCHAQFHAGLKWRQITTPVSIHDTRTTLVLPRPFSWTRRWTPYSHEPLVNMTPKPWPPGVVSTNVDTRQGIYSTAGIALCALLLPNAQARTCPDGGASLPGLARVYAFTCVRDDAVITCVNQLGDAIRYRPGPMSARLAIEETIRASKSQAAIAEPKFALVRVATADRHYAVARTYLVSDGKRWDKTIWLLRHGMAGWRITFIGSHAPPCGLAPRAVLRDLLDTSACVTKNSPSP